MIHMPETEQIPETCNTCGKQKRRLKGMSITQWIFSDDYCKCDIEIKAEDPDVQYCSRCSNRVSRNKKGSLTQWIFLDTGPICNCEEPLVESLVLDSAVQAKTIEEQIEEIDPDLTGDLPIGGDRYSAQELIAVGNSRVYKCWDNLLNRNVAVKILTKSNWNEQTLIWFQNEAKLTSKLIHPKIVEIYDFGIDDHDEPYMVIEYIDATTLAKLIVRQEMLSSDLVLEIGDQVADALIYAHEREVFHRDLTPSNVMLLDVDSGHPTVKVIDFGIATINNENESYDYQGLTVAGTPLYMSPDQLNGLKYDARSEIYSIGCVLFEALTGKTPFDADDTLGILACHAKKSPPLLSEMAPDKLFSEELESFISKTLAKDPKDRFQNMIEFQNELKRVKNLTSTNFQFTGEHTAEQALEISSNKSRALTPMIGLLVAVSVCVGAIVCYLCYSGSQAPEKPLLPKKTQKKISDPDFDSATGFIQGFKIAGLKNMEATDESLEEYKNDTTTNYLNLSGGIITDKGLDKILHLPLISLNVSATKITDVGLKKLATIKTLKTLTATDNPQLSPKSYSYLRKLPELKILSVTANDINATGLKNICTNKSLTFLSISRNKNLGDTALNELSKLPKLNTLYAASIPLTRKGVKAIARLKTLTHLKLVGASITDDDMVEIAKLKLLSNLNLSNTKITDKGLKSLVRSKNLRSLRIVDCKNITKQGKFKLMQALPKCIINDHGLYKGI